MHWGDGNENSSVPNKFTPLIQHHNRVKKWNQWKKIFANDATNKGLKKQIKIVLNRKTNKKTNQGTNLQNIQVGYAAQYQKNKQSNQKMDGRST